MRNIKIFLFVLYFLASLNAWYFSYIEYKSLSFHPRDYSYYLEFPAKIVDKNLENRYSINPIGKNMFLQNGAEGSANFFQSLHFEPVKYIFYPGLYVFTSTPILIFGFIAFLYFFPIAYIAIHLSNQSKQDSIFLFLLSIVYIIFPSSFFVPSFDLRPYVLLGPVFLTGVLAFLFSKSTTEKILWFNILFLIREEALIFSITTIFLALVIDSNNKKLLLIFAICWVFWATLITAYFIWTGYESEFPQKMAQLVSLIYPYIKPIVPFRVFLLLLIIVGLFSFWLLLMAWKITPTSYKRAIFMPLAYSTIFFSAIYQLIQEEPEILQSSINSLAIIFLFTSRYAIYFLLFWGLVILIYIMVPFLRIKTLGIVTTVVVIFILLPTNFFHAYGYINQLRYSQEQVTFAKDIFELKDTVNSYTSKILTDGTTHQAFYDFNNVYMYNRLPWHIEPGRRSRYPENKLTLEMLIEQDIDYIVISTRTEAILQPLIVDKNLEINIIFNNGQYMAAEIVR